MTSTTVPSTDEILAHLKKRQDDRPPAVLTSEEQARLAASAALDKKAEALLILDLSKVSDFTDIFIICSGTNERQVKAIAENIQETMRLAKVRPLHVEGFNHGRWVLLDYGGDFVVHVFHDEVRGFYDLDRLWSDAPDLTERLSGPTEVESPEAESPETESPETESTEAASEGPS